MKQIDITRLLSSLSIMEYNSSTMFAFREGLQQLTRVAVLYAREERYSDEIISFLRGQMEIIFWGTVTSGPRYLVNLIPYFHLHCGDRANHERFGRICLPESTQIADTRELCGIPSAFRSSQCN